MATKIEARNADLADIAALLQQQQAAKVDVVVPMSAITSNAGVLSVEGTGVFEDGKYRPTAIADGHIAAKLGIPVQYLRELRVSRPDLFDANVNGMIHGFRGWLEDGSDNPVGGVIGPDNRSVLLRTFNGDVDEDEGVLRAMLSDRYDIIDNLDVLMAVLDGVRESGTQIEITGADLTETRMTLRIAAPDIVIDAPELMKGYRNPFGGDGVYHHEGGTSNFFKGNLPEKYQRKYGVDSNGVSAGLVVTNSETGGGSFSIVPRLMVLRCTNGAMMVKDAMRQVHLGGKMEEGAVNWSADTQLKHLQLITAKARDAVQAFLSPEYVTKAVDSLTESAGVPLEDPAKTIEVVSKKLAYSQEAQAGILDHFIKGGQVTSGGVFQAVTAYAQIVANPDVAFDLEASAVRAMELAAA